MGETLHLLWKCSRELLNNLLLCSEGKLSCIGTQVKVWTKWSSLKLNLTSTILYLNINNTKMLVLMMMKEITVMRMVMMMMIMKVMIKCFSSTDDFVLSKIPLPVFFFGDPQDFQSSNQL